MIETETLFNPHNARSRAFEDHEIGDVAFVSNGLANNGILGFVEPLRGDRVFNFMGICISAFCEATVQVPPFIARGNGGSGLTILEPKQQMSYEEMLFYAATIREQRWKFSFGRMVNRRRLRSLKLGEYQKTNISSDLSRLVPAFKRVPISIGKVLFKRFRIDQLFRLERGDFHSLRALRKGKYPTVSRTTGDNGIVGYYSMPKQAVLHKPPSITVSTTSGDAFVQLEEYLATDNVVICTPKERLSPATLFFVALMLNREKWRYSYGRQCYKEKFAKTVITLPIDESGLIDERQIERIVSSNSYWRIISAALRKSVLREQPTINHFA